MQGCSRDVKCLVLKSPGVKCYGVKWFTPIDEIIIIMHHEHHNMHKRPCSRFCQYIGLLGLHAWTLQGCQTSWHQMSWRQMLWRQTLRRQMVYSQRRDNHHRAPRTPQHAEKVLQTQHPLSSIYWATGCMHGYCMNVKCLILKSPGAIC